MSIHGEQVVIYKNLSIYLFKGKVAFDGVLRQQSNLGWTQKDFDFLLLFEDWPDLVF